MELPLIATNYDRSWTQETIRAATSVLFSRYDGKVTIEQLWNEELNHLTQLAQYCSICQNPEVVYTEHFFLSTESVPDTSSVATALAVFASPVTRVLMMKYRAVKLEFRLCPKCLTKRTHRGLFGKETLKISQQDYYHHPLCEFFIPLGLTNASSKAP
jgi:hypothetical protein